MARDINWDEPLSDEDRAWAIQREDQQGPGGRKFSDLIQANDEKHGRATKDQAKSREERRAELRTIIADAQNEMARLDAEEAEETNRNTALAGSVGDREAGLLVRDNTPVNGETPEGASTAQEDYSDERYWTKARLQEEIRSRNTEREAANLNPLPLTGNRSELVERLLQDDEEIRASEGQED
jgi:hypothetical protein